MITRYQKVDDVISAYDLTMLQKVFDEVCDRQGLARTSDEAEGAARKIFTHYKAGARDRASLLRGLDHSTPPQLVTDGPTDLNIRRKS